MGKMAAVTRNMEKRNVRSESGGDSCRVLEDFLSFILSFDLSGSDPNQPLTSICGFSTNELAPIMVRPGIGGSKPGPPGISRAARHVWLVFSSQLTWA